MLQHVHASLTPEGPVLLDQKHFLVLLCSVAAMITVVGFFRGVMICSLGLLQLGKLHVWVRWYECHSLVRLHLRCRICLAVCARAFVDLLERVHGCQMHQALAIDGTPLLEMQCFFMDGAEAGVMCGHRPQFPCSSTLTVVQTGMRVQLLFWLYHLTVYGLRTLCSQYQSFSLFSHRD
jgi:hypothetical protein